MKTLLEAGANVNAQTNKKETPLLLAVKYFKDMDIIRLLINEYNADINLVDEKSNTPLLMSTNHYYTVAEELMKFLIENNANVNHKRNDEVNSLMLVSRDGKENLVTLLLDNKADIDAINNSGSTALHYAVSEKCYQVVKKLILFGADTTIVGWTLSPYPYKFSSKDGKPVYKRNYTESIYGYREIQTNNFIFSIIAERDRIISSKIAERDRKIMKRLEEKIDALMNKTEKVE